MDAEQPETGTDSGTETETGPKTYPGRRTILLGVFGGTATGTLVGTYLPKPPLLHRSESRQSRKTVRVHGGDDIGGARRNALRVWELTPNTRSAQLRATYTNVGTRSSEQIARVRNLLTKNATDLVVIDPQFLPELVGKGLIRRFDDMSSDSLRDLGCFPGLISQCRVEGRTYAVPMNADAPMLVVNRALLPDSAKARVTTLPTFTEPRAFWNEARAIAALATSGRARTIQLQTGDYEGMTVCLVELISAFGGDVSSDPAMSTSRNQRALQDLRTAFAPQTFMMPVNGSGDEAATVDALERGDVAVARLWPAQCHGLIAGAPTREAGAGEYDIIPIPGGVLGGQVLAVAARSANAGAALEAGEFLAQPMSQLQLFSAAGYVPTLQQVHAVTSVQAELRQLGGRLAHSALRPSLQAYELWSEQFHTVVRNYLVHDTDDVLADVSRPLAKFRA